MRIQKAFIHVLACLCCLFASVSGQSQYREAPVGLDPVHVRVIWTSNPRTEAVISWSTGESGTEHAVHYSTQPVNGIDAGGLVQQSPARRNGAFSLSKDALQSAYNKAKQKDESLTLEAVEAKFMRFHYHHSYLRNLKPDTRYYFRVVSDGNQSSEFYFRTAPDKDIEFKVLAGGDSRSGLEDRIRVNQFISSLVEKDDSILAFLHGGDYVALGPSDSTQWNTWLYDYQQTYADDGRILPIIPTRGNHEKTGNLYDEVFCWPGNEMNIFTTYLSPDVFLITLNTNLETGGDQRIFLESALQETPDVRWRLVQYHQPAYPATKGPGPALQNWVPLFEKYKVPLVIEADGHTLKRTVPIIGDQQVEGGVVYVGEGGMGVKQRVPKLDRWYLQSPGMASSAHHVQVISFSKKHMQYQALGLDGEVLDSYLINKQ